MFKSETALAPKEQKEREVKEQRSSSSVGASPLLPTAILDGFKCPITRELMEEPVLLVSDGYSYERKAIEAWLNTGPQVSPTTGAQLTNKLIVPNHSLREAIQHFLKQQPSLAALRAEARRAKTQAREVSDLMLAVALHEEELQKKWGEKTEHKAVPAKVMVSQDAQLKECTAQFIEALNQHLKSQPSFRFASMAAVSYASTVIGCLAKPTEALQDLLDNPEHYSIPASVGGFVERYLAAHSGLQELRQRPELARQLKVVLSKADDLSILLAQLRAPVAQQATATTSSSSSSSSSSASSLSFT